MRIRVLSDLHMEFAPFYAPPADADVVVLAGDVAPGLRGLEWARSAFGGAPVVYVAGNHEFYCHATPKLADDLAREAEGSPVHVLENAEVVTGGVRFLGCTLWTDFDLFGERIRSAAAAHAAMNDFRLIRVSPRFRREQPARLPGRAVRRLRSGAGGGAGSALSAPPRARGSRGAPGGMHIARTRRMGRRHLGGRDRGTRCGEG